MCYVLDMDVVAGQMNLLANGWIFNCWTQAHALLSYFS